MLKHTFFVFDLDDTLYPEADYLESGIRAVILEIKKKYNIEIKNIAQLSKEKDLWGVVCQKIGLPISAKDSFIWSYRLHTPTISLKKSTQEVIEYLKKESSGIAILTDGRSYSQREKLVALGIADIPAYISEEFQSEKPAALRYEIIEKRHPAQRYVYIGDNPKKDFLAPNQLGWITIGLKGTERNIHSQDISNITGLYLPHIWIDDISEVPASIKNIA